MSSAVQTLPVVQEGNVPETVAPSRPQPTTVMELLQVAVERGTPIAELKELMTLHERLEQKHAAKAFADAMARFQAECPPIRKGKTARFVNNAGTETTYDFASLDQIAKVVNPLLAKYGLSYTWSEIVEGTTITVTCTVRHTDGHSQPASIALPTGNAAKMSDQQKVGSALTFGRRLSLTSALGITTADDDTDGADTGTVEKISATQVAALEELIVEKTASLKRFLAMMKVEQLSDIPANEYQKGYAALSKLVPKAKSDGAL